MQFIRTQYRQRPTKWIYLQRYYNIQRTLGKELRSEQRRLLLEGRMSLPAYQHDYNLEACTEWKWIQNQLRRASTKPEPLKALNQINIYRLEQCVDAIEDLLKRAWDFIHEQDQLPLEETEGYKYNTRWNISQADIEAFVASETSYT